MWYDPDSKKIMHFAAGDCAVLIKLDENSEMKREKGKGGHMFCWECMMMFMMRTRVLYSGQAESVQITSW